MIFNKIEYKLFENMNLGNGDVEIYSIALFLDKCKFVYNNLNI